MFARKCKIVKAFSIFKTSKSVIYQNLNVIVGELIISNFFDQFVFDASLRRPRYSLWKIQVAKLLSIARSEDTVAMFQYQTFAFSFTAYINIPTDKKVPMKNKIVSIIFIFKRHIYM